MTHKNYNRPSGGAPTHKLCHLQAGGVSCALWLLSYFAAIKVWEVGIIARTQDPSAEFDGWVASFFPTSIFSPLLTASFWVAKIKGGRGSLREEPTAASGSLCQYPL